MFEDYLNTNQVAQRLGVSTERVLQFIRIGRLKAVKAGRDYFVLSSDLSNFEVIPRIRTGRPAKKSLS